MYKLNMLDESNRHNINPIHYKELELCYDKVYQLFDLITKLVKNVFIVTNGSLDWVRYSIITFFPKTRRNRSNSKA